MTLKNFTTLTFDLEGTKIRMFKCVVNDSEGGGVVMETEGCLPTLNLEMPYTTTTVKNIVTNTDGKSSESPVVVGKLIRQSIYILLVSD